MGNLIQLLVVALIAAIGGPPSGEVATAPWIGVHGNHLVDRTGHPVRLLGVNRSGAEYQCVEANEIFYGPSDSASIEAMKSWRINAVRVPLNESCWLGINGVAPSLSGAAYRDAIVAYVRRLEQAGLYVILDLHWAAPGRHQATEIIPLPDADHAPAFWRSVASTFREDHGVLFDLYNEARPGVDWRCWEMGCKIHYRSLGWYRAVGMRRLVAVVRATGATQPLLLSGIHWARDLGGWIAHRPPDPAHAEVASNHTYDFSPCYGRCRTTLAGIARRFPVVTSELGEGDCKHGYIDSYMGWADRHGISYLGWTWDAHHGWTCRHGPSLIKDYRGAPTQFGIGLREHLRAVGSHRR